MVPPGAQRHCSTVRSDAQVSIFSHCKSLRFLVFIACLFVIIVSTLAISYIKPQNTLAQPVSREARIVTELKEMSEDFGYMVDAQLINNRYTGMQDLLVSPAEGGSYETQAFLRTICAAAASVTSQNPPYQNYVDMLMMDVNGELWAISTASCRKALSLTTEEKQNALLQILLQQLK